MDELDIIKCEEAILKEKAMEEENEKQLKEFAKELEETESGWVDKKIMEKVAEDNLLSTFPEDTKEAKNHPTRRTVKMAANIPSSVKKGETFDISAPKDFWDSIEKVKRQIWDKCKGEVVYNTVDDGGLIVIIVFEYNEVESNEQLQHIKSSIEDILNNVLKSDCEKWEVELEIFNDPLCKCGNLLDEKRKKLRRQKRKDIIQIKAVKKSN